MRSFFLRAALLLASVTAAMADGEYQHTKDGKTFVWNNDPKPGDEATWSGDRDREGYATGFGTLTWYTGKKQTVRPLGIPLTSSTVYARYYGKMVRGKFDGLVNVHSKGKTNHATFIDGKRTTRWAAGPAPSRRVAEPPALAVAKPSPTPAPASTPVAVATPPPEPPAPAEKPQIVRQPEPTPPPPEPVASEPPPVITAASPPPVATPPPAPSLAPTAPPKPKKSQAEVENSLRALVGPPSSLHAPKPEAPPAAPPSGGPRLTKEEVVDLAAGEARRRGYDVTRYQSSEPQFDSTYGIWSLSYEQAGADETQEPGKHLSVTIDDKTKGIVFVARR